MLYKESCDSSSMISTTKAISDLCTQKFGEHWNKKPHITHKKTVKRLLCQTDKKTVFIIHRSSTLLEHQPVMTAVCYC